MFLKIGSRGAVNLFDTALKAQEASSGKDTLSVPTGPQSTASDASIKEIKAGFGKIKKFTLALGDKLKFDNLEVSLLSIKENQIKKDFYPLNNSDYVAEIDVKLGLLPRIYFGPSVIKLRQGRYLVPSVSNASPEEGSLYSFIYTDSLLLVTILAIEHINFHSKHISASYFNIEVSH